MNILFLNTMNSLHIYFLQQLVDVLEYRFRVLNIFKESYQGLKLENFQLSSVAGDENFVKVIFFSDENLVLDALKFRQKFFKNTLLIFVGDLKPSRIEFFFNRGIDYLITTKYSMNKENFDMRILKLDFFPYIFRERLYEKSYEQYVSQFQKINLNLANTCLLLLGKSCAQGSKIGDNKIFIEGLKTFLLREKCDLAVIGHPLAENFWYDVLRAGLGDQLRFIDFFSYDGILPYYAVLHMASFFIVSGGDIVYFRDIFKFSKPCFFFQGYCGSLGGGKKEGIMERYILNFSILDVDQTKKTESVKRKISPSFDNVVDIVKSWIVKDVQEQLL